MGEPRRRRDLDGQQVDTAPTELVDRSIQL
jgi:hypothetical protein